MGIRLPIGATQIVAHKSPLNSSHFKLFTCFNTNMYKVQFEVVPVADLKKVQQKINTWLTTGHIKKFEMHVLPTGDILFNLLVKKTGE